MAQGDTISLKHNTTQHNTTMEHEYTQKGGLIIARSGKIRRFNADGYEITDGNDNELVVVLKSGRIRPYLWLTLLTNADDYVPSVDTRDDWISLAEACGDGDIAAGNEVITDLLEAAEATICKVESAITEAVSDAFGNEVAGLIETKILSDMSKDIAFMRGQLADEEDDA